MRSTRPPSTGSAAGIPVTISNCSNNYGPFQFPEKMIPLMVLNALEGRPLPVYGQGRNVRDWLYVTDHCKAVWKIMKDGTRGETYNIGGQCEMTNIDLVNRICDTIDEMVDQADLPPQLPDVPTIAAEDSQPGIFLLDGVKLAIDCFEQCRFSGAVRAKNCDALVLRNGQRQFFKNARIATPDRGIADIDQRRFSHGEGY